MLLVSQVEQQDQLLSQLQAELRNERTRHQDTNRSLQQARRSAGDLNEDMEACQKQLKDLTARVRAGKVRGYLDTVIFFFCL